MTLRIMLMGLVASLGLELPSGPEFSSWTQSGRDWVRARVADRSGSVVEADRPEAGLADCHQADGASVTEPPATIEEDSAPGDAAFLAASEATRSEFLADSSAMHAEPPAVEEFPALLSTESTPPVGLPDGEELAQVDQPDDTSDGEELIPTRAERVESAIRLTRDAVRAWSELMHESPEQADSSR